MRGPARRVGLLVAGATAVAAGVYVLVYLERWEWNRAQISALLFVAAEVALVAFLLSDRLNRIDARLHALEDEERRRSRLRETRPPARDHFAWLRRPEQLPVFVPILIGAGALLSALAWLVERAARATAGQVLEDRLNRRLARLSLPSGGLVPPSDGDGELGGLLTGPAQRTA